MSPGAGDRRLASKLRRRLRRRATGALVGLFALLSCASGAPAQSFVPDLRLDERNIAEWRAGGTAEWKTDKGEIVGRSSQGSAGWLMSETSLQDVALFAAVNCSGGCKAGLLFRAAPTPSGGLVGLFVSLDPADQRLYRLELDRQGKELRRTPLGPAPNMLRIAPPAGAAASANAVGPARAAAPSPGPPAPLLPVGVADRGLSAGAWNTIEVLLDANVLRTIINDSRAGSFGRTDASGAEYGGVALYVAGDGEVRFKDIGYKDLAVRFKPREQLSPRFDIQRLDPFMYSWGVAVADLNRDGSPDVIAGPNYFLGPTYEVRRELTLAETYSPSTDSPTFQTVIAHDFTGDGWIDVLDASFSRPMKLYVNPRGESRRWDMHEVLPRVGGELALLTDVDDDGQPEVLAYLAGAIALASPDPAAPTGPWKVRPISQAGAWGQHGFGVGDINGDGRVDVVQAQGWFEQPPVGAQGLWTYHPQAFSRAGRTAMGAGLMGVYDVDGDGLNDVVTGLEAHNAGLAWFKQRRTAGGGVSFDQHTIMSGLGGVNAGDVVFTQPHGSALADVDGDGVPDFIVGKRHWSHHEGTTDPGADGPAVLYVYRTVRDPRAPGGARFAPELIHNWSGAGSQVEAVDLDRNGAVDVVTSGDHGTFVFWGKRDRSASTSNR